VGTAPSLWLVLSSVADVLIISTLAGFGIAMARLPVTVIAGEFGAAIAFGAVLDLLKIPVLAASAFRDGRTPISNAGLRMWFAQRANSPI